MQVLFPLNTCLHGFNISGGGKERRGRERERLDGGREQKNEKALDGEKGRKERLREREVNELERAGGKYREREVEGFMKSLRSGGAEGGEVNHKTRERME